MSTDPFENRRNYPSNQQISGISHPGSDTTEHELSDSYINRPVSTEFDKPESLLLTGISPELIEQLVAETGMYINPYSLMSICKSILMSEPIDPKLLSMCMPCTDDYSASQRRTFKSCKDKFIDLHCGVTFEYEGYIFSIDKYFTAGNNPSLSANISFTGTDPVESWELIRNILHSYYKLDLGKELELYSPDNTLWDAGHAQFLVTDDIFISTSPLLREADVSSRDVFRDSLFEEIWLPGKIQFSGINEEQLYKVVTVFNSADINALERSGFLIHAIQAADKCTIPNLSRLWPLSNPLENLTSLDINKVARLREKDPRHSAAKKFPYSEIYMHSFETDIGEVEISFRPFSEKSAHIVEVTNPDQSQYSENSAVIAISWDAFRMSEEEARSAWEMLEELAEIFEIKGVSKRLSKIILQDEMPELSHIDGDIGSCMRITLHNSAY